LENFGNLGQGIWERPMIFIVYVVIGEVAIHIEFFVKGWMDRRSLDSDNNL
jgi:hypothetical protein